jgi:hypothetical protein
VLPIEISSREGALPEAHLRASFFAAKLTLSHAYTALSFRKVKSNVAQKRVLVLVGYVSFGT